MRDLYRSVKVAGGSLTVVNQTALLPHFFGCVKTCSTSTGPYLFHDWEQQKVNLKFRGTSVKCKQRWSSTYNLSLDYWLLFPPQFPILRERIKGNSCFLDSPWTACWDCDENPRESHGGLSRFTVNNNYIETGKPQISHRLNPIWLCSI